MYDNDSTGYVLKIIQLMRKEAGKRITNDYFSNITQEYVRNQHLEESCLT